MSHKLVERGHQVHALVRDTRKLASAGQLLDIPLLDHLILDNHARCVSLHEQHPALFGASGGNG